MLWLILLNIIKTFLLNHWIPPPITISNLNLIIDRVIITKYSRATISVIKPTLFVSSWINEDKVSIKVIIYIVYIYTAIRQQCHYGHWWCGRHWVHTKSVLMKSPNTGLCLLGQMLWKVWSKIDPSLSDMIVMKDSWSFVSTRRSENTLKHSCNHSLVMANLVSCSFLWALSRPWKICNKNRMRWLQYVHIKVIVSHT